MVYKIKDNNGKWVDVEMPTEGDIVRIYDDGGGVVETIWSYKKDPQIQTRKITVLAFKQRMTQQERLVIREKSKLDPIVYDFIDIVNSAKYIDLDREDTRQGVMYLESIGVFEKGRGSELLDAPVVAREVS